MASLQSTNINGYLATTGELFDVSNLAKTHAGNIEAYYQLSRRLQAFSHLGSTTVLEVEAITIAGGYSGQVERTTWRLQSRGQLNVTRHDENGGASYVTLKILNDTSIPDANGQNAKYVVGLICGTGANYRMVYLRARFLENDAGSPWVTITQMANASPFTATGSAMTYSSGWVANTGYTDTSFTEVIVLQKASQLTLTATTGTAPLVVSSTTLVSNLNAQYLNGQLGSYYLNAANLTGTISGDRGVTAGSSSVSFVEYNGTTATAGQFDGGTTAPSGTTRLNYGGYLYATRFYGDGSNLTSLAAGNLSGTIPSAVLANSSFYLGTTQIALNRASANIALTGITSIDGNAATATNVAWSGITSKPTTLSGFGITDALDTSSTSQTKSGALTINGNLNASGGLGVSGGISVSSNTYNNFNKPAVANYQTVALFGAASTGLFLTDASPIISTGTYYNNGWITTATSGTLLNFTGTAFDFQTFSGATVPNAPALTSRFNISATLSRSYVNFQTDGNLIALGTAAITGAITQNGNQVLHAGNYSSYALPLTGGTVTGITTFSNISDYQITLNGGGTTWAGINWIDVNGSDQIYFNGQNKTFSIGGGGSNVSGKKLHIDGGVTIGAGYDSNSMPTNGLSVEGGIQQNGGKYVKDFPDYQWVSGSSNYYVDHNAGWYKVAQITVTSNCTGAVLYGRLYDRAYHDCEIYDISVVIRAECDFTTNNESHFVEIGCTVVASSDQTNYKNKIRAILVASSTNSRTYELQFYETPWNSDYWELFTSGWTIYSTGQAPGTATGTARVNYQSKMNADVIYANDSHRAPIFYDSDNTNYYLNPAGASVLNGLKFSPSGNNVSGDDAIISIVKPDDADWAIQVSGNREYGIEMGMAASHTYSYRALKGGTQYFRVGSDFLYHDTSIRAPIFYDIDDTNYYCDPNSISVLAAVRAPSIGSSYTNHFQIREANGGNGITTDSYAPSIGFHWGGVVASNITLESSGRISIRNNPGTSYENFIANIVYGSSSVQTPIVYDSNNTNYYLDPASTSVLNTVTMNGNSGVLLAATNDARFDIRSNTAGAWLDIRSETNGYAAVNLYGGGATTGMWSAGMSGGNSAYRITTGAQGGGSEVMVMNRSTLATTFSTSVSSPIFYDSNDTNYYLNPASTSILSAITINGDSSLSGKTSFGNRYQTYSYFHGGAQDLAWKKIADITFDTSLYSAVTFKVEVIDANTNFGSTADCKPMTFFAACRRSGGVLNDANDALVYGPVADYVRAVKTATGVYELQIRQVTDWRHHIFMVEIVSKGSGTVTYVTGVPANGSTTGTNYLPTTAGWTQNLPNLSVSNLSTLGVIKADSGTNYPHSFTNTDAGNTHWTNRNDRLLTSNGTNWATDGRDPIMALVTSGNSNATTIANSIGLTLHNESQTNNTFSPAITFSNRSNSGNYNTVYAAIIGKKTGQGIDSNWSAGELHFYTMPVGAYENDIPSLLINSAGNIGIGNTNPATLLQIGTGTPNSVTGGLQFGDDTGTRIYRSGSNTLTMGGTFIATTFSGSGASLTNLPAGQLSGTIPSGVLTNSTLYVGTTAIALNRSSAGQTLTGISIDGNSVSAGRVGSWDGQTYYAGANSISSSGGRAVDLAPNTYGRSISFEFKNSSFTSINGNYAGLITIAPWLGTTASTGDPNYQLLFYPAAANSTSAPTMRVRAGIDTSWGSWSTILHENNYNSYSPTLTGTGASGTWSISVTGNAATATTASKATVTSDTTTNAWRSIVFHNSTDLYSHSAVSIYPNGGYIQANYLNSSDDVNTNNISYIVAKFGDNYHRSATAAKVAGFISGQAMNISGNATSVTNGLYTNTAQTITAVKTVNNLSNTFVNTVTNANQAITFYQDTAGADAYLTFHIGGDYAAYFGLGGAENDLVWGGWSAGNNRYRILHSGNQSYAWNLNQNLRTTDTPTFSTLTLGASVGSTPYLTLPASVTLSANAANEIAIRNLGQLRFTSGNDWDYNTWAGLKYNQSNTTLYLGGPNSGGIFSAGGSPPNIAISFVGTSSVTSNSDFRAPIFYDSNDTNYYLDPANTGTSLSINNRIVFNTDTNLYRNSADVLKTDDSLIINSKCAVATSISATYTVDINGTLHYTSASQSSDIRFKKNIETINDPLIKLNNVRGVKFEWNEFVNARRNGYELNKPTLGVIAQEIEAVFPELVDHWHLSDDCPDARAVNYERIVPILIEAVKELNNKNIQLEARLSALESKLQ